MALLDRIVPRPRPLAAVAGLALVATASGMAINAPASADPPPAAAGNTSHGFLVDRGRVTTIDHPNATTRPLDINNRGQVVGDYGTKPPTNADPSTDASIGFVLDRGRVERINLPGDGTEAALGGITHRDRITGKYLDATGYHGLLLDRRRRPTRIDFPGALATYAHKSDERGRTVGAANRTTPDIGTPGTFGYLLERGRFTRLEIPRAVETQALGINNRGKVVGEYLDRHGVYHGYVWANGRFATIDGPLGTGASIVDVNDRGDKVGTYFAEDGTADGFLLRHGEYTTFAALGLPFTLPFDINNRGQIAGLAFSDPDMTELHGFLLAKGADGPVTQVDVPGAPRTAVFGLDDRGRLVGVYENPDAPSARQRDRAQQPSLLGELPLGLARS